jgi:hypothetical protein
MAAETLGCSSEVSAAVFLTRKTASFLRDRKLSASLLRIHTFATFFGYTSLYTRSTSVTPGTYHCAPHESPSARA